MFGLIPNPWMILGAVMFVISTYMYGHHSGYQDSQLEMAAQVSKMNEQARAKEKQLTEQVNITATQLRKANNDADQKLKKLDDDIDSGAVRLFIPVPSGVSGSRNSTAASGNSGQAGTQLDPAIAKSLVGITDDGDKAVRKLNACIDAYNQVRAKQ